MDVENDYIEYVTLLDIQAILYSLLLYKNSKLKKFNSYDLTKIKGKVNTDPFTTYNAKTNK